MINILIPVYKGGDLFLSAVNSVLANCPLSVRLFISFNGEHQGDHSRYLDFQKSIQTSHEIIVNKTLSELSAIQHFINIQGWLASFLSDDDKIMFLCHDDEILKQITVESIGELSSKVDSVTFPEWHLYNTERKFTEVKKISEVDFDQSIEDFIFDTFKAGDIYTNLSGITCSFKVFKKYCSWLKFKKTGARTELMLATASNVSKISYDENIKIKILRSPYSGGSTLALNDVYYDERIFMLWLFFNYRISKPPNFKYALKKFRYCWGFK